MAQGQSECLFGPSIWTLIISAELWLESVDLAGCRPSHIKLSLRFRLWSLGFLDFILQMLNATLCYLRNIRG
jgi:hypothetical protein